MQIPKSVSLYLNSEKFKPDYVTANRSVFEKIGFKAEVIGKYIRAKDNVENVGFRLTRKSDGKTETAFFSKEELRKNKQHVQLHANGKTGRFFVRSGPAPEPAGRNAPEMLKGKRQGAFPTKNQSQITLRPPTKLGKNGALNVWWEFMDLRIPVTQVSEEFVKPYRSYLKKMGFEIRVTQETGKQVAGIRNVRLNGPWQKAEVTNGEEFKQPKNQGQARSVWLTLQANWVTGRAKSFFFVNTTSESGAPLAPQPVKTRAEVKRTHVWSGNGGRMRLYDAKNQSVRCELKFDSLDAAFKTYGPLMKLYGLQAEILGKAVDAQGKLKSIEVRLTSLKTGKVKIDLVDVTSWRLKGGEAVTLSSGFGGEEMLSIGISMPPGWQFQRKLESTIPITVSSQAVALLPAEQPGKLTLTNGQVYLTLNPDRYEPQLLETAKRVFEANGAELRVTTEQVDAFGKLQALDLTLIKGNGKASTRIHYDENDAKKDVRPKMYLYFNQNTGSMGAGQIPVSVQSAPTKVRAELRFCQVSGRLRNRMGVDEK